MSAVIIVQDKANPERQHYYGPFADGDTATHWGTENCQGLQWHWEEMSRPGSTYLSCSVSDAQDFIRQEVGDLGECYVTVGKANWVVTE